MAHIRLLLIWLLVRGPKMILLRLVIQGFRLVTGRPVYRYSRVTPNLYLGGQPYKRGWHSIESQGINAVVNLRRSDDLKRGLRPLHYLHLPTVDNCPPSLPDLQRGVAFITEHIQAGDVVYVHCGVGVGRAPTLVAAYLVSTGMMPDAAWARIRQIRPVIFPLSEQKRQVTAFYQQLLGDDSV